MVIVLNRWKIGTYVDFIYSGMNPHYQNILNNTDKRFNKIFLNVVKNSEYKEDIKQDMLFRMIKYKDQFTKLKGDQIYYYIAFILKQITAIYSKGFDYCDEMVEIEYNPNIEQSIDNQSIMNNLTMLSNYEKELVKLYYIEGLNYREISEQTKIPITSLNLTIRKAIEKIKKYYGL